MLVTAQFDLDGRPIGLVSRDDSGNRGHREHDGGCRQQSGQSRCLYAGLSHNLVCGGVGLRKDCQLLKSTGSGMLTAGAVSIHQSVFNKPRFLLSHEFCGTGVGRHDVGALCEIGAVNGGSAVVSLDKGNLATCEIVYRNIFTLLGAADGKDAAV